MGQCLSVLWHFAAIKRLHNIQLTLNLLCILLLSNKSGEKNVKQGEICLLIHLVKSHSLVLVCNSSGTLIILYYYIYMLL